VILPHGAVDFLRDDVDICIFDRLVTRAGDWKPAIATLEKSTELRDGGDASDWFFLAMAHWQLGHKDEARTWYDKAIEWMDKNQPQNEELQRFRAEAAELLGVNEKK
jgi:tetratricopeptide (TPR) repeat protein